MACEALVSHTCICFASLDSSAQLLELAVGEMMLRRGGCRKKAILDNSSTASSAQPPRASTAMGIKATPCSKHPDPCRENFRARGLERGNYCQVQGCMTVTASGRWKDVCLAGRSVWADVRRWAALE